jgi:hypothetical protein
VIKIDDYVDRKMSRELGIEVWSVLLYLGSLLFGAFIGGPVIGLEKLAVDIMIFANIVFWGFFIIWFLFLKNYICRKK